MTPVTPQALVLCERSLTWSGALTRAGFHVDTFDLLPPLTAVPAGVTFHLQDARDARTDCYQVAIAFPPCTHLSQAGARSWPAKAAAGQILDAAAFALDVAEIVAAAPIWLIENPLGLMSRLLGPPSLVVHPWMYAEAPNENRCKRTCLWLHHWPPPLQIWSDASHPIRFMDWAPMHSQVIRSQSWPGMAAAFVASLPRLP